MPCSDLKTLPDFDLRKIIQIELEYLVVVRQEKVRQQEASDVRAHRFFLAVNSLLRHFRILNQISACFAESDLLAQDFHASVIVCACGGEAFRVRAQNRVIQFPAQLLSKLEISGILLSKEVKNAFALQRIFRTNEFHDP